MNIVYRRKIKNRKKKSQELSNNFLNRTNLLCLTRSFSFGLIKEIYIATQFFRVRLLLTVPAIINQLKL